jgi:hypothetical protein
MDKQDCQQVPEAGKDEDGRVVSMRYLERETD